MIANSILVASAFASLVAAVPLAQPPVQKREVVWETQTQVAVTTIPVTVTHWLEPGETPPAAAANGKNHFGHHSHGNGRPSGGYTAQPEATQPAASSPESVYSPPAAPSSYEQPAPSPAAPTTQQAPPPEQVTEQAPPPAQTTEQASPPAQTTEQASPPAYTPQPSPEPSPSSGGPSGAPSGKEYTGDITHYDVGLGSCGQTHTDGEDVVAIPTDLMNNPANPNLNPKCGQTITISYGGQEHSAKIVDTCGGCFSTSIDLSPTLFSKVAPNGDGRVSDVKWWFDN